MQVHYDRLDVTIARPKGVDPELAPDDRLLRADRATAQIALPICLGSDRRARTQSCASPTGGPDTTLVAALRRAHRLLSRDRNGPHLAAAPASIYERKILRLALLAPDIQRDILAGRQPHGFNLEAFLRSDVPLAWAAQRRAFDWG